MNRYDIISICLICLLLFSVADVVGYDKDVDGVEAIEEKTISYSSPIVSDPKPSEGEEGLNSTPKLSVLVDHPAEKRINVSFYENGSETLIGVVEDVAAGERAEVVWENLVPDAGHSWQVIADDGENRTEGGPWNFTTAGVDNIKITDKINGTALSDKKVPPNYEEWGYISSYNDTYGFFDNPTGTWNLDGGGELLLPFEGEHNGIRLGNSSGEVWLNVTSLRHQHQDSVKYTVITDKVDYIEITDSPNGERLKDDIVEVGQRVRGYCSVYNESNGYLYSVAGNWSAQGADSSLLEDKHNKSNVIDVGHEGGAVWFNLSYEGFNDSIRLDVLEPEPDEINITSEPGGESIEGGEVPVGHRIGGNASGYNLTAGYIGTVEAEWSIESDVGMDPSMGPTPAESSWLDVGTNPGEIMWNASYEREGYWVNDTVEFTVKPPEIDYVEITEDREASSGGSVPVNRTVEVGLSAYNDTSGRIGFVEGQWNVSGGNAFLLNGTSEKINELNVGTVPGEVVLTGEYNGLTDEVVFSVQDPEMDYIRIIEDPEDPNSVIETVTLDARDELEGYSAGFNESVGFVGLVETNWLVNNQKGAEGSTSPTQGNSSVFDAGPFGGEAEWISEYEGYISDTVEIKILSPSIDQLLIKSKPNGEGEVLDDVELGTDSELSLYPAGYNETFGYQRDVEAEFSLSDEEMGELSASQGNTTTFTPSQPGTMNITAQYESVEATVEVEVLDKHTPEIVGEIPDVELKRDFGIHEINLTEYASDEQDDLSELKWYVTGKNSSVISTFGENQTGNHVITLLSEENALGRMEVRYWLVNSAGNRDSQSAWINVTTEYEAPKIRRCPDLFVHYDDPYEFDYSPYIIYDRDRFDVLTLDTDDPEHTTIEGLKVTYEYPKDMLGEEILVTITVSDDRESVSTTISVTVTSNSPPEEIEELPDVTMEQGELKKNVFDLDDYFMDPEGEPLYMSYGYTYLTITIHDNDSVDIQAESNWHGVERVTFRAQDPQGGIVEQTINVTVKRVNRPPEIKDLPPFVVRYEEPYVFDLEFYISDPDTEINELTITTNSEYVDVEGTELIMYFPKRKDGLEANYTVPLEVFVSDGTENVSEVTTVTVGSYYPPELVIPLHDVAFKEDEQIINAFDLDNHFMDRQNDTIYYSSGNEKIDVVINENHTVDFYAPENWHGQELITIRATNSAGALMEDSLTVTVIPVNDPPVISDIPSQEGEVDESWILDIGDHISDVDNESHELDVIVDDPNVEVSGQKLIFEYDEPGEYNVTVKVSDGVDSTSHTIEVYIEESETEPWYASNLIVLLALVPIGLIAAVLYFKRRKEYTIEDIFLIHDSGGLIKHITRTLKAERDEDMLAGMFTAVQNFVDDAFAEEEGEVLKRMEYGEKKVLVHKGDSVILAVFISGEEPKWALKGMKNLVSDIEERYGEDIEDWSGDPKDISGITEMLKALHEGRGKYESGDWKKYSEE